MLKKLVITAIAGLQLNSAVCAAAPIVKIPNNKENWQLLMDLRIEYMARTPESIHIVLDGPTRLKLQTQRARTLNLLRSSVTVVEDAEAQFREFLDDRNGSPSGIYHTYEEMKAALDAAVAAMPDKIKLFDAGTTAEGRTIWGVEISNPNTSGKKPAYLVLGSHHAREWISVEAPLAFIKDITSSYATDDQMKQLVDNSIMVIVPILNVDGTIWSHTNQPMWRKNRNTENGSVGVDNNRNYSYKWGVSGASSWAGSDTYKGPHAMSERENQAVRALAEKYRFVAGVSFHSYSDLILWPWSYTDSITTKDDAILKKHGIEMGKIMGYRPIQSSDLYPAAGDTDDFLYGEYNVLNYTVELGSRFVPREEEYHRIVKNAPKMLRYLFSSFRKPLWEIHAENAKEHQVLSLLESAVMDASNGLNQENSVAIAELATLNEVDISQGMEKLSMKPEMRSTLSAYIQKQRNYQSLQNQE